MSEPKWLSVKNYETETIMNNKLALTPRDVDDLTIFSTKVTVSGLIFGDYTQWCSSLVWFPIDYTKDMNPYELVINTTNTGVSSYQINARDFGSYFVGQFYYTSIYNDFRDFEPYTTAQLYLPFYGFVDLKIADIYEKYVQIRLQVDKGTGQACYTIGVTDTVLEIPYPPYMIGIDDSVTRILSQHIFQLGVTIPFGSVNAINTARNVINSAVKGVSSIAGAYATLGMGLNSMTTTSKTVKTRRNYRTGRQITTATQQKVSETDTSNYAKGRAVSEVFETSAETLARLQVSPITDKPNNTIINSINTTSVKLIRKCCNMKPVDESYNELYGKPLGEVKTLNEVGGYTEISRIHFEGSAFATATQTEISMLQDLFSDGVILPKTT